MIDQQRRALLALMAGSAALTACATRRPVDVAGRFVAFDRVPSRHLRERKVVVWLPPGYDGSDIRYATLYMHDGQNLFDAAASFSGVPWAVDRHLASLMAARAVRPTIVVAIWNTPDRWNEYAPATPLRALPPALQARAGGGRDTGLGLMADAYLRYMVEELKPTMDTQFRTRPGRDDTFVMGSSMGGLISLYALVNYPEVFGGAGCISTHWPVTGAEALLAAPDGPDARALNDSTRRWLAASLPPAGKHRLYFDHGDQGLDATYGAHQQQIDQIVAAKGFRSGVDWQTRSFPGAAHHETAWQARLPVPLTFLLRA